METPEQGEDNYSNLKVLSFEHILFVGLYVVHITDTHITIDTDMTWKETAVIPRKWEWTF